MEQIEETISMLDLMIRPAFCVKNGIIVQVNEAARSHMITPETPVAQMLLTGAQEYADFENGCLYLTLSLSGTPCGASVTRMDGFDVFLLEEDEDQAELQSMALAAQELRKPLSNILTVTDGLFPLAESDMNPSMQDQMARINRGLFQMQRIICNMSDAYRYCQDTDTHQKTRDIGAILDEIFSTAAPLLRQINIDLHYTGLQESIFCLADEEKLERAVNNILSNAVKFMPAGGTIEAKLTRKERTLYLTVQDNGSGVLEALRSSVYTRFRREPCLEDSRFGIGLGMVLIRSAASAHGGTVLLDRTKDGLNRLTMTLSIRQNTETVVRTPTHMLHPDYAGERDHRLLELSEVLPAEFYK